MTATEQALLTESVHDTLREMVFSGELEPGAPLSVPALAARLAVSRTPVREAVQQLIYEGIAVHVRNAGARVATIDATSVRAVFEVREVLDGLAAYQATLAISRETLSRLEKMVQVQRELLDQPPDRRRDARLDLEFHTVIREAAGNVPLVEALARLDGQSHLFRSDMWTSPLGRTLAVTEHERILHAIEAGDADGARVAACAHVAGLLVRIGRT
ncbi:GntR family transcriptional regulator [Rhodococcus triatomae]|uniref:DNA-binding transcriptional regulator, GntR family n=1 Tax=Rhodococcus triatomae TaxID=300028 RepID=A0A1G8L5L9_9NOCA|nr:GntR family transcriptional regulator [Rhodococcus triatomae]QNG21564.1 GntR family transcriptional regulator [Rhodococcus triatomae]QNG25697.1 GntR family transcriptional regulator [Rhodococcus triatomae]SDI50942.1 DNA-binding transcriptional regulator, GntR family [Rhodococcus triatomae]